MGLFSRDKEALGTTRGSDVPFDPLKRSPRATRRPRSTLDGNPDGPPALDPTQTAKTRARHRLIGAVVLATAAVVFVPMLFDRAPVATSDDMALQIPDRDTPFEGRRGVPDGARGPLKASSDLPAPTPAAAPAPEPVKPVVEPPAQKTEAAPDSNRDVASATTEAKATEEPPVVAKAEPRAAEPKPAPPKIVAEPEKPKAAPTDDPKALAALAGKGASPADAGSGRGYAVQIAAYSSPEKAKSMRDELVAKGLKSYTESVSTSQGVRIRVRLGPYASHDAADQARQKLKTMKLDGSVVPL
jgi:DedD protein